MLSAAAPILVLALLAPACGSSSPAASTISCAQSLTDYCSAHSGSCVMHLTLSNAMTSLCSQCSACSGQTFAFETCEDGTVAVVSQVGTANQSQGVELLTYLYDGMTFNLLAVLDSTSGGSYQASVKCLGGAQTVPSHGVCAPFSLLPFKCP
jgi:hypothetical protein